MKNSKIVPKTHGARRTASKQVRPTNPHNIKKQATPGMARQIISGIADVFLGNANMRHVERFSPNTHVQVGGADVRRVSQRYTKGQENIGPQTSKQLGHSDPQRVHYLNSLLGTIPGGKKIIKA